MTIRDFLSTFENDEAAAAFLGVKSRTIGAWRRGERIPRPMHAKKLIEKSGNLLTYHDIYNPPT